MYEQALDILQSLQSTRTMLRAHVSAGKGMVGFAVPHTLAFTFFPNWVSAVHEKFGPFRSRLFALNVHDAVMRLVEGGCDLLIAYYHSSQPFQLDPARYEMVSLGHEVLAAYSKPDADGNPIFMLPGQQGQPLPYLGYAAGAYLGRVTELILKESSEAVHLERVYETDMAEGLKAMALEGHGVAFLPYSAVRGDLEAGRLVRAVPEGMNGFQMDMEVRAYREKPQGDAPQGGAAALWAFLKEQGETANGEIKAV